MIAFVYGTTAELIKLAPVYTRLVQRGVKPVLWCTGQQIDELPEAADRLSMPQPDVWLAKGVSGRSLATPSDIPSWLRVVARNARRQRRELEASLWSDHRPPLILVHGDTMTTVIGAMLGRWLGATVGHIEAGLRSERIFSPFPEEIDRRVAAVLAHVHYTPGADKIGNLRRARGLKVDTVANTVLDSLRLVPEGIDVGLGPLPSRYGLVSLHRFELVQSEDRLRAVFLALARHAKGTPIYAVTDPVTSAAIAEHGLDQLFTDHGLVRLPKLPYFEFVTLLRGASFVVTDSGGLQEECAYLDIPCLVHRLTTERPDGIGRNVLLSGFDLDVLERFLHDPDRLRSGAPLELPSPSDIIVDHLERAGYAPNPHPVEATPRELSVIVPAYREAEIIRSTLTVLLRALDETGLDYEVIVVSDGSTDGTQYEASQVATDRVKVLHYADNAGKGFAVRYGFAHAQGELVAFIDAGMAIEPRGIGEHVAQLRRNDADVVTGAKMHDDSVVRMPATRRVQMHAFGWFVGALFGLPVRDTQTGLKVFRKKVLDEVIPYTHSNGFAFDIEVLAAANDLGFRIEEGPVEMTRRLGPVVKPHVLLEVLGESVRLGLLRRQMKAERRSVR